MIYISRGVSVRRFEAYFSDFISLVPALKERVRLRDAGDPLLENQELQKML